MSPAAFGASKDTPPQSLSPAHTSHTHTFAWLCEKGRGNPAASKTQGAIPRAAFGDSRGPHNADPVAAVQHGDAKQPQAPPHQHLPAIIRIARILPHPCSNSGSAFPHSRNTPEQRRTQRAVWSNANTFGKQTRCIKGGNEVPVLMKRPLLAGFCLKAYFWKSAVVSIVNPTAQKTPPMMSEGHKPAIPHPHFHDSTHTISS